MDQDHTGQASEPSGSAGPVPQIPTFWAQARQDISANTDMAINDAYFVQNLNIHSAAPDTTQAKLDALNAQAVTLEAQAQAAE